MNSLAAIHVGKKQLGLDEETYRDFLARVTGKRSAKDMDEVERHQVVAEMRRQGFKPLSKSFQPKGFKPKGFQKGFQPYSKSSQKGFESSVNGRGKEQEARSGEATTGKARKPRSGLYRKLQALWIAGYNLGLVRVREDKALDAFIREKCGGSEVQAVEALKGWLSRDAGIHWASPHHKSDKERVAAAQWLILCSLDSKAYHPGGYMAAVRAMTEKPYGALKDDDWHHMMNALGERLRGLKAVSQEARQTGKLHMRGGRQDEARGVERVDAAGK